MSDHAHHSPKYYVKIWAILLVLLVVSILGPELGNKWITLITAFGIAIVKAYMVAAYFMHLNVEKKYISYMLIVMVAILVVFFAGTHVDLMNFSGHKWEVQKESFEIMSPIFRK